MAGQGRAIQVVLSMTVYVVTGKLGGGKTLCSVGRIRDKLKAGCVVATNLDLDLVELVGPSVRDCRVLRVPDKPSRPDLDVLGCGNPEYDESRNGLLVLDELGTWLNSRSWQDKSRAGVIDWFLHARKLGWDLILIVQDIDILDAQARAALAEMVVYCRRLDRIQIPLFGPVLKLVWGERVPLPRVHIAAVRYGSEANALRSDSWVYRGNDLFRCYDTRQAFLTDYPHGTYTVLPPWYTRGRFMVPRDWGFYMRMTRIVWRRFRSPVALAAGLLAGVALTGSLAFADAIRQQRLVLAEQRVSLERMQALEAKQAGMVLNGSQEHSDADKLAQFDGLRVVGWVGDGKRASYVLGVPGSAHLVRSDDLIDAGFNVFANGRCAVTIRFGAASRTITCVDPVASSSS